MKAITNKAKRLFAMVLAAMMVLSVLPTYAFAVADDFTVKVSDTTSAPIKGASVAFQSGESTLASASTNEAGEAKFDSEVISTADRYSVSAFGYEAKSVAVSGALASPLDVVLTAIEKIDVSGTVKDGNGDPISGASVNITGYSSFSATTGEDGAFLIAGVYKTGSYTLSVSKDTYKTSTQVANLEASNDIVLVPKESVTLTFDLPEVTLSVGSTATNAVNNAGGRSVSYTSADPTIVAVDNTGKLQPVKVGVTTITATCEANETLLASSGTYTVTITKGTHTVSFEKGVSPTVELTDARNPIMFSNNASSDAGLTNVVYSVVSGEDLIDEFDTATGSFKIVKVGSIKIRAEFSDENYEDASADYTLTVTAPFVANGTYKLEGSQRVSPWYYSNVTIKPETSGYTFLYKSAELNEALGYSDWMEELLLTDLSSLTFTPNGVLGNVEIYIKNTDGAVVEAKLAPVYKDSAAPTAKLKVEEKDTWSELLYIISFGTRGHDGAAVLTVTASDPHSNVAKIQYFISAGASVLSYDELTALDEASWIDYTTTIPGNPGEPTLNGEEIATSKDAFFTAYARVFDVAGNVTYVSSSGIILDTQKPTVTLSDLDGNEITAAAYYTSDIALKIDADDGAGKSGIRKIEYWVNSNGQETQRETLYSFENSNPAFSDLISSTDQLADAQKSFTIVASDNSSDNVVAYVSVTDNAGNTTTVQTPVLKISSAAPTAMISFSNNSPSVAPYYKAERKATITITERTSTFDPSAAFAGIQISAKNGSGAAVAGTYSISDTWTTVEGATPDQATHTATVEFGEANYTFAFTYTNKAGQQASVSFGDSTDPSSFTVDLTNPIGTIKVENGVGAWDNLVETLTFGLFRKEAVTVKATVVENTSPLVIEYFKTDRTTAYTASELNAMDSWQKLEGAVSGTEYELYQVSPNEKFTVYLRATDKAGRVTYLSTNGVVVDDTKTILSLTPDHAASEYGYYSDDVKINISANDAEPYSGIKSIEYWVLSNGIETQRETLFSFDKTDPTYEELIGSTDQLEDAQKSFTIMASTNNTDNVQAYVKVVDNAGNEIVEHLDLKINQTAPTVVVNFAQNDSPYASYYASAREATIVITDRTSTFNAEAAFAGITITAKDVNGNDVAGTYTVSDSWTTIEGDTPDDATHRAVILFGEANYTFSVTYTNKANKEATVSYGTSSDPNVFTVDLTAPVGTIKAEPDLGSWDTLIETLTFGLYSSDEVTVKATVIEQISPLSVEYLKMDRVTAYTASELEALDGWQSVDDPKTDVEFELLKVAPNEKFTVYLRAKDSVGRQVYLSTNGIVVDDIHAELGLDLDRDPNAAGFYNDDIDVTITANDIGIYSGLKSIEYWVTSDGVETQREVIFAFNNDNPTYDELISSTNELSNAEKTFTIDATLNNSDNVIAYVTVTDNAGNTTTVNTGVLKINSSVPTVDISFDNNTPSAAPYYNATRKATIVITDRTSTFNAEAAFAGITITAKDVNGNNVAGTYTISDAWTTVEGNTPDEATHTATILFNEANYTFSAAYTNKADKAATVSYGASANPNAFTIDLTNPAGTVTAAPELGTWDSLIETLTFGLYSKSTVTVKARITEATSPLTIDYFKTDRTSAYTANELNSASGWTTVPNAKAETDYTLFEVSPNEKFTVYLRATDAAGRITYLSTNGIVVDDVTATLSLSLDRAPNTNSYYNSDISVFVTANDTEPYSGLKSIEYWVTSDGVETQREVIFAFDNDNPTYDELISSTNELSNAEKAFTIDATLNNSDNVIAYVTVTDNAGNATTVNTGVLKINSSVPTVDISFDNNTPSAAPYYNATRKATIVITDRTSTFNAEAAFAGITITAKNVNGNDIADTYTISDAWTTVEGNTPDEVTHTATILFNEANYTFSVAYTNKADKAATVSYGASTDPNAFTVDLTNPSGTVTAAPELGTWDSLIETLTFGLYSKSTVTVKARITEATSPLTIEYFKTDRISAYTANELNSASGWTAVPNAKAETDYTLFEVSPNEKFTVYLRATDAAGRITYLSTNGIVADNTSAGLTLTPDKSNGNGYYNSDVTILIAANDTEPYSGIKSIEYWVTCDDIETQRETVFSFNNLNPIYSDLIYSTDQLPEEQKSFVVDSVLNNSDKVTATVKVRDNAGNETTASVNLKINSTIPSVSVSYDNNNPSIAPYYNAERTASIVITDRTSTFDAEAAFAGISITANDINNNAVDGAFTVSNTWTTVEGSTPDEATHTATVRFSEANYTFSVAYKNKADTEATVSYGTSTDPNLFTVDLTDPSGKLSIKNVNSTWEQLLEALTFGIYSNESLSVTAEFNDETSPIIDFSYYKSDSDTAMTKAQLASLTSWNRMDVTNLSREKEFNVTQELPNQRFTIYSRITDASGRITYVSTDGAIVDNTASIVTITKVAEPNNNGFYKGDVDMAIAVNDPETGGAYSGINSIAWWTECEGAPGEGTADSPNSLYIFQKPDAVTYADLLHNWENNITLNAEKNNSNAVKLFVTTTDNAGNTMTVSHDLSIDITAPTIKLATPTGHLNTNQTVTITITERNFDPEKVVITASRNGAAYTVKPTWTETAGTGNGDDTTHVGTVAFTEDGDYAITRIVCTDLAGNETTENFTNTFTVDKTAPVITITYDNNAANNGNYYKEIRTATITVVDTNFDTGTVSITATDDGRPLTPPVLSAWVGNGNTHTATVQFAEDAFYSFSFSCKDRAGNTANQTEPEFFVDTTNPYVEISGIDDESANNSSDNIGFVVTATDTNFDVFEPVVSAVIVKNGIVERSVLNVGVMTDITNGKVFTVSNLPEDGIYRITCTVIDKAGNAFTEVTLVDAKGEQEIKGRTEAETLLQFSVNRKGSTFELDDSTFDTVDKYYIQNVVNDVVVIEVNVDTLNEYHVTLNSRELTEGTDFTVSKDGGNGEWMRYVYTINKNLFIEEGEYNVVVSSVDRATNNAFSDVRDARVDFVVDRTAPIVSISGMETNGRYQTDRQLVSIIPTDDGGELASLLVVLVDQNGEIMEELINLSGDDLLVALQENGGIFTVELEEGLYQNVRVVCKDRAVDENGSVNTYDELFKDVSVSSSAFMIFWANKPLRYGSISTVVIALGAMGGTIIAKRRKKTKAA